MGPGPDKIIVDHLKTLIELVKTDSERFNGLMAGYEQAEIDKCYDNFKSNPPLAKLGFARTSDHWPVWAVILAGKRPYQEFIGRNGGVVNVDGVPHKRYISVVSPSISIWVYTENADTTRWHSDLCEGMIASCLKELLPKFEDMAFGGAMDLTPEQAAMPETIWVRSTTWEFTASQQYLRKADDVIDGGILTGQPYVGTVGDDLGDGHTGGVVPFSDR